MKTYEIKRQEWIERRERQREVLFDVIAFNQLKTEEVKVLFDLCTDLLDQLEEDRSLLEWQRKREAEEAAKALEAAEDASPAFEQNAVKIRATQAAEA